MSSPLPVTRRCYCIKKKNVVSERIEILMPLFTKWQLRFWGVLVSEKGNTTSYLVECGAHWPISNVQFIILKREVVRGLLGGDDLVWDGALETTFRISPLYTVWIEYSGVSLDASLINIDPLPLSAKNSTRLERTVSPSTMLSSSPVLYSQHQCLWEAGWYGYEDGRAAVCKINYLH